MKYESIEEIYEGNQKVRARLKGVLSSLTPEQVSALPEGEKWTIAEIVEHIAIVDENTAKICARLLRKAQESGHTADGSVVITDQFLERGVQIAGMKVEAPDFVKPSGALSISDSIAKLDETATRLEEMRTLFARVDGTTHKFPHPFFGDISAHEWLALKGGHEMRHLKQIEKVLQKVRMETPEFRSQN